VLNRFHSLSLFESRSDGHFDLSSAFCKISKVLQLTQPYLKQWSAAQIHKINCRLADPFPHRLQVGLLGPNGAGKSTTFNITVGRERPTQGCVMLNGQDITPLSLDARARLGVGYLTQVSTLTQKQIQTRPVTSSYLTQAQRGKELSIIRLSRLFCPRLSFTVISMDMDRCFCQ
jgi:ABC-type branched-subunit amino acid transport system ATPase component